MPPHFISVMVICGMIRIFLSPSGGLINLILGTEIDFLTQSSAFRTIYIASGIWQDAGWGCIIYLATLANVDVGLYEAAKVDGASVFQRIWNIDLPALLPMAILNLIMAAGGLMNVGFEKVWLLQTDLNKATSDVIAVYVYEQGIQNAKYSYSTAVGLFNTAVNIILLLIVNKSRPRPRTWNLFRGERNEKSFRYVRPHQQHHPDGHLHHCAAHRGLSLALCGSCLLHRPL